MVHCVKFWTDFKFHWYAALSLKSGWQQCFPLSASGYILYIWDKEPQRLYQDSWQTALETSFHILWRLSAGEIPFLTSAFFALPIHIIEFTVPCPCFLIFVWWHIHLPFIRSGQGVGMNEKIFGLKKWCIWHIIYLTRQPEDSSNLSAWWKYVLKNSRLLSQGRATIFYAHHSNVWQEL